MNKLLLGVLLCLFAFNVSFARHYGERTESETLSEADSQADLRKARDHNSPPRHRKRRWQSYGYDYPPPYFADRRDSYNNHELIPQIYRILDDISSYIKRQQQQAPPPPPQPIYIPYPVPYYVPKYVTCKQEAPKVNITRRFPELDDVNQNWGFVTNDLPDESYDDSDSTRPISFEPIKPKQTKLKRPAPPVEHGSNQGNSQLTTSAPIFDSLQSSTVKSLPPICNSAIVTCCSFNEGVQRNNCFLNVGCTGTSSIADICSSKSINDALEAVKNAYAPAK